MKLVVIEYNDAVAGIFYAPEGIPLHLEHLKPRAVDRGNWSEFARVL